MTDGEDEPCEGADVRFEVDDNGSPSPTEGDDTTDEQGEAGFEFSNTEESTNEITAFTNADGSLPDDCEDADHVATATKHWVDDGPEPDGCPTDLTPTPDDATTWATPTR